MQILRDFLSPGRTQGISGHEALENRAEITTPTHPEHAEEEVRQSLVLH